MIVTTNRRGRLTTDATPPTPAELAFPAAAMLTEPQYYFHPVGVSDASAPPYLVCARLPQLALPARQVGARVG